MSVTVKFSNIVFGKNDTIFQNSIRRSIKAIYIKRSSIAQFFNVNSTKIRLVIIGRREGHGRERGGTEWRKKGRKK